MAATVTMTATVTDGVLANLRKRTLPATARPPRTSGRGLCISRNRMGSRIITACQMQHRASTCLAVWDDRASYVAPSN
jgi:hypothetical protein